MGATQYLGYQKLLRLSSAKSASYEDLITYCTNDINVIREGLTLSASLIGKLNIVKFEQESFQNTYRTTFTIS